MKIVHIVPCLQGGGIQNFLVNLTPEQVALGHTVTVICIEEYDFDYCQHLADVMSQHGVSVICLGKKRHNKVSFVVTLVKCVKLIRKIRPDIVNTHGIMSHLYGVISTMCRKSRHIITVHNAPEKWGQHIKLLCRNKSLIYCSHAAYEMRVQKNLNVVAIDNGISRNIVHTESMVDLKKELNLKPTDKIIILVGSLRKQKNYEFLKPIVDEMADLSIHFCICGGNYGAGYVSMDVFKDYPQIHCLGLRSDVSAIENGADLFMSVATFEGLPIAVLEAYFNGIPCVLSPIPQHEKISGVDKVWIPKDINAASYAQAIYEALACNDSHEAIYEMRKKQLEVYSITQTAKEYLSFYEKNL